MNSFKRLVVGLVVVLTMLVSAKSVDAGYYPSTIEGWYYMLVNDQLMLVTSENLAMVERLHGAGRRAQFRALASDIYQAPSGFWGLNNSSGGFIPVVNRRGEWVSTRQRVEQAGGIVLTADGARRIVTNWRNPLGWFETAAGAVLLNDSRHRSKPKDQPLEVREGQQVLIDQNGNPVKIGTRPNWQGPVSNPPSAGEWRVSNRTSKRAELWDGEQFVARIEPWQSVQVSAPASGYKAVLLIPNRSGGLDQEAAQIRSSDNFNGWDILAPAVQ